MNYHRRISLIGWETRSRARRNRALVFCRDYGFTPVTRHVFVGEIYEREERELRVKFAGLFTGKADRFFFGAMCASCFNVGMLEPAAREKFERAAGSFELVQISEDLKNKAPAHHCREKDIV